ncbi:MAG: MmgE/PrpD family protein [Dehalococcoidia bacterium]|nr:MmgE/PrpD family protein [Dehalococcoidia bacterium]
MGGTVTQRLAAFIQSVTYEGLPDEVRQKVKACILNAIGVGMAAYNTDLTQIGIAVTDKAVGGATILVNGARASLPGAAFANAVMFYARGQDDMHDKAHTHVGTIVVPAALAIGQARGSSGRDFAAAVLAGYETACALGATNASLSDARVRATSIYGILGAAAAAGKLLRLDVEGLANALGFAASIAGGTNQSLRSGTMEWQFQPGIAAHNGVLAALLAANGGVAAETALEGPVGFLHAFTGTNQNAEGILAGLGEKYRILDVAFNPVPVPGMSQGSCVAALELAAETKMKPEEIATIEIRMAERAVINFPGAASRGPFRDIGATVWSTPYCVSLALSRQQVTLQGLQLYNDPTILGLLERTTVVPSDLPPRSCDLKVTTVDGRTFEKKFRHSDQDFAYGFDGVTRLMRSLAPEMAISAETLEKLIDVVANIESCEKIDSIIELLTVSDS